MNGDLLKNKTSYLPNKQITYTNPDGFIHNLTKKPNEEREQYIAYRAIAYTVCSAGLIVFGGNTVITALSLTGNPMLAALVPGALLCILGICSINGIMTAIKENSNTHDEFHSAWLEKTRDNFFNCIMSFNKNLLESVNLFAVGLLIAAVSESS
jgi:hypothetical protein